MDDIDMDVVAALPHNVSGDTIYLVSQHRPGYGKHEDNAIQIPEVVIGCMDPGYSAEEVAAREVREETGAAVSSVRYLGRLFLNPTRSGRQAYIFYVAVAALSPEQIVAVHGCSGEGEATRVIPVPRGLALSWAANGTIQDTLSIATFHLFEAYLKG